MSDLDLNGDGVIDLDEFCRWYFTGMKPFNNTTKSMLIVKNQAVTVLDLLAKEDIQKLIKEDKRMTKHKVKLQFNEPTEDHFLEGCVHILGPVTEKL